jgi:cold shock CspA family protein
MATGHVTYPSEELRSALLAKEAALAKLTRKWGNLNARVQKRSEKGSMGAGEIKQYTEMYERAEGWREEMEKLEGEIKEEKERADEMQRREEAETSEELVLVHTVDSEKATGTCAMTGEEVTFAREGELGRVGREMVMLKLWKHDGETKTLGVRWVKASERERVVGTVKWFNESRGYDGGFGMIHAPALLGGECEIFFIAGEVDKKVRVAKGSRVTFVVGFREMRYGDVGLMARDIQVKA